MSYDLRLGDCLDPVSGLASLADGSVDHVITDPPYSPQVHANRNSTRHLNGYETPAIDFAALEPEQMRALAAQFARVVRGWVLIFTADHLLGAWIETLSAAGVKYRRTGAWVKADPMPQMTGDRPAMGFELIALGWAWKGRSTWNGGGRALVYQGPRGEGKRVHPTQKPAWLMDATIRDFTSRGDLVLDPFVGSGSTGVAAIRAGRRFVGWERDEKHHRTAAGTLAAAREQLGIDDLVVEPRAKQVALFGKEAA